MHRSTRLVLSVFLSASLQGGCAPAPPPRDPVAEMRAVAEGTQRDSDRLDELVCTMAGVAAVVIVQNRDERGVTLPEAMAAWAEVATAATGGTKMLALLYQSTLAVYAHPEWTQAEAWAYAQQECLRMPPR